MEWVVVGSESISDLNSHLSLVLAVNFGLMSTFFFSLKTPQQSV